MKKYISILFSMAAIVPGVAQEEGVPTVVPDVFAQKISPNGKYFMAQDFSASAILYDIDSQQSIWYPAFYPGNGNCVANNGVMVGQDMETLRASVLKDGKGTIPQKLYVQLQSSFDAVTPDFTRVCGWIQNSHAGALQIPFYCDIDEEGNIGAPQALPVPEKDFFNVTPQFCTATYISNDGRTIAGILQDDSGFFGYPIVYIQDDNGDWSYVCPSEPLFNPEHLPIPQYPDVDNMNLPDPPQITDYMTEEMKKEWEEEMAEYEATGDPDLNPWGYVVYFTGEEGYEEYVKAIGVYNQEVNDTLGVAFDEYWKQMAIVGKYARFIPNMALSPDGKTLVAALGLSDDDYTTDTSSGFVSYKFNLAEGSLEKIETKEDQLIPYQILNDGTIVSIAYPNSVFGYNSYLYLPEATDYITFDEYIAATNPLYLPWLEKNLNLFGIGVISGCISFNEDMSVIVGGNPYGDMFSYIIASDNAGIEGIEATVADQYIVYNLSGIKVLATKDKTQLSSLPKGIYIINGKKIKL